MARRNVGAITSSARIKRGHAVGSTSTESTTIMDNTSYSGRDGWVRASDLRPLLTAMRRLRDGDLHVRLPAEDDGILGSLAAEITRTAERNRHFADELNRVCREVVRQGRLDARLSASPGQGAWTGSVEAANTLIDALVEPTANATRVLEAVADGDLTQRMDLQDGKRPQRGDLRRLARRINQMVDQLSLFTNEVTRLAREVGTDGRLGRRARVRGLSGIWRDVTEAVNTMGDRAQVRGVSGVWRDLTDNVNFMADNLTSQVRNIAQVTTSVANGDLSKK